MLYIKKIFKKQNNVNENNTNILGYINKNMEKYIIFISDSFYGVGRGAATKRSLLNATVDHS